MPLQLQYNLELSPESRWNIVSATAFAKTSLTYAQEVGDFVAGPGYDTVREGYDSYLIKLTIDGCGTLAYEGQIYSVPAGHFFWIDCQKYQHYGTAPEAEGWHTFWVHFYGVNTRTYHEEFLKYNNGSPVGMLPDHSKVGSILHALLELDNTARSQIMMDFQASDLLTQLMTNCLLPVMSEQTTGDIPQIIQSVRVYLQNHYQEKLTLEELGNRFNINPYYLQKQFKRYVGMSPSAYHIFLRMTQAKELIRSTKRPIGEIAYMVGIENQSYFTRQFREWEGMSPQEYRRIWPSLGQPIHTLVTPEKNAINKE